MRLGPSLLASIACAVSLLAFAHRSRADEVHTLHLRDGSSVTGEIVESVPPDHVLVRVAPGVEARVAWSALSDESKTWVAAWQRAAPEPASDAGAGRPAPATTAAPPAAAVAAPPFTPPTDATPAEPSSHADRSTTDVWSDPLGDARRVALGVRTGYPSPFGYLGFTATWFPLNVGNSLFPTALGLELTVSPALGYEPFTVSEMVLLEVGVRRGGIGIGLGAAESALQPVIPGDDPGVAVTLVAHVLHLRVNPLENLSLRLVWGAAVTVGAPYCQVHPSACPQLEENRDDPFGYFIDFGAAWTFDFGRHR